MKMIWIRKLIISNVLGGNKGEIGEKKGDKKWK